jgi:glucosylceramidase
MSKNSTRRTFLQLSALGLATSATAKMAAGSANATPAATPAGEIKVWITDQQSRCAQAQGIAWRSAPGGKPTSGIVLDPGKTFQTVLGFGAAFTDSACYMFNQLAEPAREQILHEMFHPSEMGLNVCRTCMGASDYSTKEYSYDEGDPDPDLKRFSIDHDRQYILPILLRARKTNPDLFLFSTPWSPPGWMKSGGSMLGGSMRRRYLGTYSQYFLKFLQAYAAEGVPIQAVTPQNEVDTDQDGRMPACIWPQEYEIEFVNHLGPLLKENGVSTKIWILDHNFNLWGRATCELDDPGVREHCQDVAWHGYYGTPDMVNKVHEVHPNVAMHWTEGGPDYTSPDYLTDWAKWGQTFTSALRNWCESITGWNLALDEKGRPNIGPFPCGGVVSIHSQTKEITRSGQFWALAQFSRFIRRGARRFDSQGTIQDMEHVGLENPDGQRVLVLSNAVTDRTVTVHLGGMAADVNLKKDSVATLVWA